MRLIALLKSHIAADERRARENGAAAEGEVSHSSLNDMKKLLQNTSTGIKVYDKLAPVAALLYIATPFIPAIMIRMKYVITALYMAGTCTLTLFVCYFNSVS